MLQVLEWLVNLYLIHSGFLYQGGDRTHTAIRCTVRYSVGKSRNYHFMFYYDA